ncbi:MAG: hypothetical protein ACTSPY_14285 [Candidatus Helarchaeota archaeon]
MNLKRLFYSILLGVIFGAICATGVYFLIPETTLIPNRYLYIAGAFYNRIIMGSLIGFAEELKLIKNKNDTFNSIIRGAILGIFVSVGFGLLQAYTNINFFIMGIIFGLLNDLITTKLTKSE